MSLAGKARLTQIFGILALIIAMSPGWSWIGPLSDSFRLQLGLNPTSIGFLATLMASGYIIVSIPAALRIDAGKERWAMTWPPALLSAAFLATSLVGSHLGLLFMAVTGGALWVISVSASYKYAVLFAPVGRQGIVLGAVQTTIMWASGATAFLLPLAAKRFGWRTGLVALAANAVIAGVVARRCLEKGSIATTTLQNTRLRGLLHEWPHFPGSFYWLLIHGFFMGIVMFSGFAFVLLSIRVGGGMSALAASTGQALYFIGGGLGRIAWGLGHDRFSERTTTLLVLAPVGAALSIVAGLLLGDAGSLTILLPVFSLGFFVLGQNTVLIAAGFDMSDAENWALVGACITVAQILGGLIGPAGFGYLVRYSGGYGLPWVVLLGALVVSLVPLAISQRSNSTLPGDRDISE